MDDNIINMAHYHTALEVLVFQLPQIGGPRVRLQTTDLCSSRQRDSSRTSCSCTHNYTCLAFMEEGTDVGRCFNCLSLTPPQPLTVLEPRVHSPLGPHSSPGELHSTQLPFSSVDNSLHLPPSTSSPFSIFLTQPPSLRDWI